MSNLQKRAQTGMPLSQGDYLVELNVQNTATHPASSNNTRVFKRPVNNGPDDYLADDLR